MTRIVAIEPSVAKTPLQVARRTDRPAPAGEPDQTFRTLRPVLMPAGAATDARLTSEHSSLVIW